MALSMYLLVSGGLSIRMSPTIVLIGVLSFYCIGNVTAFRDAKQCSEDYELPCDNGECVNAFQWCDNYTDCEDGSDEAYCRDENEPLPSELSLRPTVLVVAPHVDLLPEVQRAVRAAVNWLLRQRKQDFSWGSSTPRAIVALSLADEVIQLEPQELQLMKKQLSVLLSVELMKTAKSRKLSLGRLAQYINALYATCQNPRQFQGMNLIKKLRSDTTLARAKNDFSLPIVFLTLCLAEECEEKDLDSLVSILKMNGDKLDLKSIALMAMSCITELHGFRHRRSEFLSYLSDFQYKLGPITVNDIYTKALILQALLSGDKKSYDSSIINSTSLLRLQREDGSFGDILATYNAIPALLNENLQSLKYRKCEHEDVVEDDFTGSYVEDSRPVIKITYSLWIENGNDVDVHTMEIEFKGNKSFYDIMKIAKKRNHLYRFLFYESDDAKAVYSIAGIPDDPERGKYWILYVSNSGVVTRNTKYLQKITKGLEEFQTEWVLPEITTWNTRNTKFFNFVIRIDALHINKYIVLNANVDFEILFKKAIILRHEAGIENNACSKE